MATQPTWSTHARGWPQHRHLEVVFSSTWSTYQAFTPSILLRP